MPSVYLALHDDMGNYIITIKRILNRWWGGALSHETTIVNQAGQYALPGGGIEGGETARQAAYREFREETGIDLAAEYMVDNERVLIENDNYAVIDCEVSSAFLKAICLAANANIRASPNDPQRPNSAQVRDWEHAELRIVRGDNIGANLGVALAIPAPYANAVSRARRHSQLIDWYGAIGTVIQEVEQGL